MKKIAIFASGSGTNFEAIADAISKGLIPAELALMVCDVPGAKVIKKAEKRGIDTLVFDPKAYENKKGYEMMIVEALKQKEVYFIVLAGYMRLLSNVLLDSYPNQIVNIHPSLLPAFKGKDAITQAIDYGVKVMGVSIHYVNQEMDGGAIIAQKALEITGLTHDEIETRIHHIEHQLYPETLNQLLKEHV
ncbi:MAG: phosphoribosylglycinamide formyltransferase [Erysipelotrichaceae bacterium]